MTKRDQPSQVLVLGATSTIAVATERLLAPQGCSFYLVARNGTKLDVVAADLRLRGASAVHTRACDLDDTGQHAALLMHAVEALGRLDLVLLAYGVLGDQRNAEADFRVVESVLRTNLLSPISLVTWLANYFEQQEKGTLAVISSVAGDRGRKSNYVYGTSKGALSIFLQGVRNRLCSFGVDVLTIKPGVVTTPMTAHLPQGTLFASPEKIARGILSAISSRQDEVYLPWFWGPIMATIRAIPESLFKRLSL